MKLLYTLSFLVALASVAHAQTYTKALRATFYSNARRVINTADGGFLVAGIGGENSFDVTTNDLFVMKFSPAGRQQWAGRYGTPGVSEEATSVIQTRDGGFLLTGFSTDAANQRIGALVKIDSAGNKLWSKTFFGASPLALVSSVQTANGGYIAGGNYTINGTPQPVFIKLAGSGAVTSYLKPAAASGTTFRKLIIADNGDIVMLLDNGTDNVNGKLIVERVAPNGTVKWATRFGGTRSDFGSDLIETRDKGFAVTGGNSTSRGFTTYMATTARLDGSGHVQWYRSTNADATQGSVTISGYSLLEDADGTLISCGTVYRDNGSLNIYLLKYSVTGAYVSSSYIDLPASSNGKDDYGRGIIKLKDGYLLASTSPAYGMTGVILKGDASFVFCQPQTLLSPTMQDTALVQNSLTLSFTGQTGIRDTDALSSISVTALAQSECTTTGLTAVAEKAGAATVQNLKVYPNPAASVLTLAVTGSRAEKASLAVYDLAGNLYLQQTVVLAAGENRNPITVSSLHSGSYQLRLTYSGGVLSAPFYKQ